MSLNIFDNCQHLWKTDDKDWMDNRKAEWRLIQHRLASATYIVPKKGWKHLKRYFLMGDTPYYGRSSDGGPSDVENGFLADIVLQLWFHPVEPDLGKIKLPAAYSCDFDWERREIGSQLLGNLYSAVSEEGSDYGAMGGREKVVMAYLNPGLDYRKMHDFGDGRVFRSCFNPYEISNKCMGSTIGEIYSKQHIGKKRCGKRYVAYKPGIYLWDHFDFLFEHYPEAFYDSELFKYPERLVKFEKDIQRVDRQLNTLLQDLITFSDRPPTDDAVKRPQTVEFVEGLVSRYEKREFTDGMLLRWDQAKQSIKTDT